MRAFALAVLVAVAWTGVGAAAPVETSCTGCHLSQQWFGEAARALEKSLASDVHANAGLSCQDCHGGDADPALAGDAARAMDPDHAANPFRGLPERGEIPAFCGRCHSDPAYMKRFAPSARVDQEREYETSGHGRGLRRGNLRVATCVDCHGGHGIRRIGDPKAPVHPLHVAETCASCHASADTMAGSVRADGSPIPIDQFERWRRSVHAEALFERGDLSAPTCNDCHGSHGATPPGIDSLAKVCGRCHGREATIFEQTAKREGFHQHNAVYLAAAGGDCGSCHVEPDPQAKLPPMRDLPDCAACHHNHAVVRPSLASLSPLPAVPCAFCHEPPATMQGELAELEVVQQRYVEARTQLLQQSGGREGEDLFDWMVDQALALPQHQVRSEEGAGELSPAFARLYERFRIGRTHFTYVDPKTGEQRRERVVHCADCHAAEPLLGSGRGYQVSSELLLRMRELTGLTARAERTLLRARRGGVSVQAALSNLDRAVDAQIQLEVLLHAFRTDAESEFAAVHREGVGEARAALDAGRAAFAELGARRRFLAVSLGLVALVLVAMGAKIRSLGR